MIKFLHTADLQLGKAFRDILHDRGSRLREFRLESIDKIAQLARTHHVDFVLVAGDLFDAHTVDGHTASRAAAALSAIPAPVLIIPGNHDHGGDPTSIFNRHSFKSSLGANVRVVTSTDPIVLCDGRAVVFPCPLMQRHVLGDTTAHITKQFGSDAADATAVRIGLAHGGVVNFGAEEEGATNQINPERAREADLDYLALGDWHGTLKINDRTWYSGTPEPDRFKNNQSGNVLLVEIHGRGAAPAVTTIPVAQARWIEHNALLNDDIGSLRSWLDNTIQAADRTLVKFSLEGSLSLTTTNQLETLLGQWAEKLLHLRHDDANLARIPTEAELDAIAAEGPLKSAVDKLRNLTNGPGQPAADATLALRLLHRLVSE